ncbi:hypothetical protein VB776_03030 [Arcicella sp. DC2W]|uniref:Uncharacterized protein n=1 Tax=Arcicella gelida TaxID=2984195 RepID=A0ABU5S0D6_9BACT|nr:hypothetical protein [Arcicella sp. DC2W]MEA5401874.1 hypothetical protein [Arcicella sp. DC2W]
MELDELKYIWQQTSLESISSQVIGNDEFLAMMKGKSNAVITKLKRNLILEILVSILFLPVFLYFIFFTDVAIFHKYVCSILIFTTVATLVIFWVEYRSLQAFETRLDLITSLKITVKQFSKFIRIYMIINYILLFPMMFYGLIVGLELNGETLSLKFLLIYTIIISPLGYFWIKFYIRKVYGQHLDKLKNCLAELAETTD